MPTIKSLARREQLVLAQLLLLQRYGGAALTDTLLSVHDLPVKTSFAAVRRKAFRFKKFLNITTSLPLTIRLDQKHRFSNLAKDIEAYPAF